MAIQSGVTASKTFEFVRGLAANLKPELDLPAFPDVVRRLQVKLLDDRTTVKDIVTVISSEPVLAARLMQMANSAAMNPAGTAVGSLNNAVSRLGFNLVRTVATAFAMRQLSKNTALGPIRPDLEAVWRRSNDVAATCFGVGKRVFPRQADEAMMTGLLHSIGQLYILMHTHQSSPELRADPDFQATLEQWQPVVGKAILEAWGLPVRICDAVEKQDFLLDGTSADHEPLTRLLGASRCQFRIEHEAGFRARFPEAEVRIASVTLGKLNFVATLAESHAEVAQMKQALAA